MAETATAMQMDSSDARHRREEQERRAKRKAGKISKSDAQREKDRKSKEYRQKILQQHGHASEKGGSSSSSSKKLKRSGSSSKKPAPPAAQSSVFQDMFAQRAQGFQIDFRFRNAPPRPPVGPTFVGDSLDAVLLQQTSRQYKPLNAVEAGYVWKLHCEADLGVPLAPSAMDLQAYSNKGRSEDAAADNGDNNNGNTAPLHPDDVALLDWKGSMGDTAADQLHVRQEKARAAARQWLQGGGTAAAAAAGPAIARAKAASQQKNKKKAFSRVLKEDMQTWMKKTTYLSNDFSSKVHDFKSLAQTKRELAVDLQAKQDEMAKRREVASIQASFEAHKDETKLQHPTNKKLKPVSVLPFLPHVANWGRAFTHVVIDKAPNLKATSLQMKDIAAGAFVANVEKRGPNERMSCQLMAPQKATTTSDENSAAAADDDDENKVAPVQTFDLDVVPLKEEDAPHANFCLWVDKEKGVATYLPISSRIQLSTGRPVRRSKTVALARRPLTVTEEREMEERMAEVDREMAEKHGISTTRPATSRTKTAATSTASASYKSGSNDKDDNDDGEDDFGDDDSDSDDDEQVFGGGGTKTIIAED